MQRKELRKGPQAGTGFAKQTKARVVGKQRAKGEWYEIWPGRWAGPRLWNL